MTTTELREQALALPYHERVVLLEALAHSLRVESDENARFDQWEAEGRPARPWEAFKEELESP